MDTALYFQAAPARHGGDDEEYARGVQSLYATLRHSKHRKHRTGRAQTRAEMAAASSRCKTLRARDLKETIASILSPQKRSNENNNSNRQPKHHESDSDKSKTLHYSSVRYNRRHHRTLEQPLPQQQQPQPQPQPQQQQQRSKTDTIRKRSSTTVLHRRAGSAEESESHHRRPSAEQLRVGAVAMPLSKPRRHHDKYRTYRVRGLNTDTIAQLAAEAEQAEQNAIRPRSHSRNSSSTSSRDNNFYTMLRQQQQQEKQRKQPEPEPVQVASKQSHTSSRTRYSSTLDGRSTSSHSSSSTHSNAKRQHVSPMPERRSRKVSPTNDFQAVLANMHSRYATSGRLRSDSTTSTSSSSTSSATTPSFKPVSVSSNDLDIFEPIEVQAQSHVPVTKIRSQIRTQEPNMQTPTKASLQQCDSAAPTAIKKQKTIARAKNACRSEISEADIGHDYEEYRTHQVRPSMRHVTAMNQILQALCIESDHNDVPPFGLQTPSSSQIGDRLNTFNRKREKMMYEAMHESNREIEKLRSMLRRKNEELESAAHETAFMRVLALKRGTSVLKYQQGTSRRHMRVLWLDNQNVIMWGKKLGDSSPSVLDIADVLDVSKGRHIRDSLPADIHKQDVRFLLSISTRTRNIYFVFQSEDDLDLWYDTLAVH
jgi:hypothetical protein